ncbi:MAG: flagellar biosynthesis protein FliQ [Pseudomonadota bacterium]
MEPDTVIAIAQHALTTTAMLAAPLLLSALAAGLLIGMFQAATQIQELTLSFIPKLIVLGIIILIAGPWMLRVLVDFTERLIINIPRYIGVA